MNKLTYFILGFLTCLLPLCCVTAIDFHTPEIPEPEIIFNEKINYSEPEKIEEVTIFEPTIVFTKENSSIDLILKSHDFDSWTEEEKTLICYMMHKNALGEQIDAVTFSKASVRVLELHLDLLKHAGYV